jgi:predicted CopG family antitoxin
MLYLKGELSIIHKKRDSLDFLNNGENNQRNIEIQKCIEEEEKKAAPHLGEENMVC